MACFYCQVAPGVTKDHFVPKRALRILERRRKIDDFDKGNVVYACVRCNSNKGSRLPTRREYLMWSDTHSEPHYLQDVVGSHERPLITYDYMHKGKKQFYKAGS